MQKKWTTKMWSFFLSMVLIVAMALVTTGCGDTDGKDVSNGQTVTETPAGSDADQITGADTEQSTDVETEVIGEGQTTFYFSVVNQDGNEKNYEIHTDKTLAGEALQELELIAGDEGDFGLYVKTVDGITADYDKDGVYWAFYENGEYAMQGVDQTEITEGAAYSFKIEK